ncbi:hypothetical protein Hanom_Chr03g00251301 [Helianthus anomalus]
MDGVNEPDESGKVSNLLHPVVKKQTFGRKSQNWRNLKDENGIFFFVCLSRCNSWFLSFKPFLFCLSSCRASIDECEASIKLELVPSGGRDLLFSNLLAMVSE